MNRFGKVESEGKYNIVVPKVLYMLGIDREELRANDPESPYYFPLLSKFMDETPVKIIRYLSCIRTDLFVRNKILFADVRNGDSLLKNGPVGYMQKLKELGIDLYSEIHNINGMHQLISKALKERINNVQNYFPDWVEWEYIKSLFIIPNGTTAQGIKDAVAVFYNNIDCYPYHLYFNWKPDVNIHSLFGDDAPFLLAIYQQNNDHFTRFDKLKVEEDGEADSLCEFVKDDAPAVLVIDGENSNPYRIAGMLDMLKEHGRSLQKAIVLNDKNASSGWNVFSSFTDIPVDLIDTKRVMDSKSMVDIVLTAKVCEEHFKNGVSKFIIGSSDSDFFGVMGMLDAQFFVVGEHGKFSPLFKGVLKEKGIGYCFLDDLIDSNSEKFIEKAVSSLLYSKITECLDGLNLNDFVIDALTDARVELSQSEKSTLISNLLSNAELGTTFDGHIKCLSKESH